MLTEQGTSAVLLDLSGKKLMKFAPQNIILELLEVCSDYGYDWSHSNKKAGGDEGFVNAEILFPFG